MPQVLILTRSIDIAQASKIRLGNMRSCIEQMAKNPRVKSICGVAGDNTGWAALCEVPDRKDAERIAALAQVYGQTNVEVIPPMPAQRLQTGLEEAERIAEAVPQPVAGSDHGFA